LEQKFILLNKKPVEEISDYNSGATVVVTTCEWRLQISIIELWIPSVNPFFG
jgi:hypothetical protein